jgi:hypothetical protein
VDNGGAQTRLPPATHALLGADEHKTPAVKLEREDADMLGVR